MRIRVRVQFMCGAVNYIFVKLTCSQQVIQRPVWVGSQARQVSNQENVQNEISLEELCADSIPHSYMLCVRVHV